MKLEIIIPNYNGSDLIQKNLPQVIDAISHYEDARVTIVDDGSRKEEQEKLMAYINSYKKTVKTKIDLEIYAENLGFSSNVNRAALKSNASHLLFLNSDVSPQRGFLQPLLKHFEDEKTFGVGCMDKSIEGEREVLRGRGIVFWRKGLFLHRKGDVDKAATSWVSGGSSMVRADIFQQLGGFDPLYNPFYWEDIDISYRAQKAGYKTIFEKESVVTHSHSLGAIKKNYRNDRVMTISYRNQFIFIWKNITDLKLIFSHLLFLPYHILFAIIRGDINFLKGLFLAIKAFPDIMKKRKKQKKSFILKDKDIIRSIQIY